MFAREALGLVLEGVLNSLSVVRGRKENGLIGKRSTIWRYQAEKRLCIGN
jgi:hypothetical protein